MCQECKQLINLHYLDIPRFIKVLQTEYNNNNELSEKQKKLICLCLRGYTPKAIVRKTRADEFEGRFNGLHPKEKLDFFNEILAQYQDEIKKKNEKLAKTKKLAKTNSEPNINRITTEIRNLEAKINSLNINQLKREVDNFKRDDKDNQWKHIYVETQITKYAPRINEELNNYVNDLIRDFIQNQTKDQEMIKEMKTRIPWFRLFLWLLEEGWTTKPSQSTPEKSEVDVAKLPSLDKIIDLLQLMNNKFGNGSLRINQDSLKEFLRQADLLKNFSDEDDEDEK
jgi:hypothetical protein